MEIVLHLGAHKTASTYLQRRLRENREPLRAAGVVFAGPTEIRAALGGEGSGLWSRLRRQRRQRPGEVLARLAFRAAERGATRLVISEENLIGHLDALLLGEWCYAEAAARLANAVESLTGAPLKIAMAVRNYADFLPTAYAQALRTTGFVPFDEDLHHRLVGLEQGWPDLVAAVRSAVPRGTGLVLWQYEEMPRVEPLILADLVGEQLATSLCPLHERPLPGPTDRAIRRLHTINRMEGPPSLQRIKQVLKFNNRAKGLAPFDPWSPRKRSLMERRYRDDLARIAQLEPSAFLHPVPTSEAA